ncbi:PAS domain-containing protein [Pseudaminobacter sp. NGMCC 1.201702]|uniref:PAS domain-containing protein n=1 Tax=Pseudaminobacter sp. NGMCC 1.201702 TaxID=3391825 RepID=UPI0039EE0397
MPDIDMSQRDLGKATSFAPEDVANCILKSAANAIVASDRDGTIVLWNPGAERVFGFTEQEALGQS